MNNIKFLKTGIGFLIFINIFTLSFIWLSRPPQNNARESSNFLIQKLSFNNSQRAGLTQLEQLHQQQIMPLKNKSRAFHKLFFSYLGKEKSDSLAIKSALDSIVENQKKVELLTFQHFGQVRALCDEAQKQKFDTIIDEVLKMKHRPPPPHLRK